MPAFPTTLRSPSDVELVREPGLALIGLRRPMSAAEFRRRVRGLVDMRILRSAEAGPGGPIDREISPRLVLNNSTRHYWVKAPAGQDLTAEGFQARIAEVLGDDLDFVGPVYRTASDAEEDSPDSDTAEFDGLVCPVPNVIVFRVRDGRGSDFEARLESANLPLEEIREQSRLTGGRLRHYRVRSLQESNAYTIRNQLRERMDETLASVHLQSIPILKPVLHMPDDGLDPGQYYQAQWNLSQINAERAWDLSQGNSDTFVCVIDDGVKLGHPDLAANIAPGGGVTIADPALNGDVVDPALEWHGTMVAGIAAAEMDNQQGIAGLAGHGRIYPIKFDFSDVEFMTALYHVVEFASGANRRVVVNMSFGWTDKQLKGLDLAGMDAAIQAADAGNCLLCAATGNEGRRRGRNAPPILYPSRHPLVMACGASGQDDYRCSNTSSGYEANYGTFNDRNVVTGVSVVAPGLGIWCPLADGGYGPRSGTSMATPLVAALGVLLIAAFKLSASQARTVIEENATKVHAAGGAPLYVYVNVPGFPSGSRTDEVGYGRIDAFSALQAAQALVAMNAGAGVGAGTG